MKTPSRKGIAAFQSGKALRCLVATLVLLAAMPADADQASSLYAKGRDVEDRQDYEAAYAFYSQASQLKPKNIAYRLANLRVRVFAASQHVHRGQQLRENGKLEEALTEFLAAAAIDPSAFTAQQEVRRTRIMIAALSASGATATPPGELSSMQKRLETSKGPVELAPFSTSPVTMKLTEDPRVIFATFGRLTGLNVVFDPDYNSANKKMSVDLTGVTLTEALQILCMQSKTFWRPVTPNTIFVALDSPGKRKELEQNGLMTFYLSNLDGTELQDVVATLRSTLDVNRITPIPSQSAIVVRGTPDQLALAGKLIDDMDKAKPEVIVEVAIMQISREKIRDLGIQLPTSTTVSLLGTTTTSGTSGTAGSPASSSGSYTLNQLAHLNANNFALTIPQATATALFSDSQSKLLQNPQIRALDGVKASLKIGSRVPVATGSFSGVGGAGASPLVNTQFQYLDVGVNIDITPRVHANNEITLKVSLEISAVDSTTDIGGITQPVIGQRKIDQEIRLKEGEANVVGGMLEDSDSKSFSGLPWLSSVPILRYLFSSEHVDKRQNELVFVLTPRIVRGQELSHMNRRLLDVGTANTIELRASPAVSVPVPPPASITPQTPAAVVPASFERPPNGGVHSPSGAPLEAALSLTPVQSTATIGQTFMVDVIIDGAQNLFAVPLELQYDKDRLQLVNASSGSFLGQGNQPVTLVHRDDPIAGKIRVMTSRPLNSGGVSGKGQVLSMTFMAKADGPAVISVGRASIEDANNKSSFAGGAQAVVQIR